MATNFGQLLNNSFGGLIGLPKSVSVESIIKHVQKRLPQFANENRNGTIENEEGLTQALIELLNVKHSFPFNFQREYMEDKSKGNSPRSDFGVVTIAPVKFHAKLVTDRKRIFTFEAKRLTNLGKNREKEYLVGAEKQGKYDNSGGVERFKNGTHGNGLGAVGIIGYVQSKDFLHWSSTINQWIDELILLSPLREVSWTVEDKLVTVPTGLDEYAYYKSNCIKKDGNTIIHHLWANLVRDN